MAAENDRRAQIVEATLALLAQGPLSEVTTRRIAQQVGITQPGLFRHFLGRDAIVLAAIDYLRDQIAQVASQAVDPDRDPLEAVGMVVQGVVGTAVAWPGLPRLLFQDVGGGPDSPFRGPLAHLSAMQVALLSELTRRAVVAEQLPSVDTERAAELLLGLIQGTLLRWQQGATLADAGELVALWARGIQGGALPAGAPLADRVAAPIEGILALDTRPLIARGVDPLSEILAALDRLTPDGLLELAVPFRPAPLISLLERRGFRIRASQPGPGLFSVEIRGPQAPEPLDLRDLPAPEPMTVVLEAAEGLGPEESLLARTPQLPALLLGHLEERGLAFVAHQALDGSGLLYVHRPGPTAC